MTAGLGVEGHYSHGRLIHAIADGLAALGKIGNMIANIETGAIAPVEIIARRAARGDAGGGRRA
jgi:hypothetical protein